MSSNIIVHKREWKFNKEEKYLHKLNKSFLDGKCGFKPFKHIMLQPPGLVTDTAATKMHKCLLGEGNYICNPV